MAYSAYFTVKCVEIKMEISYLINEIRKNIDDIKDYNVFVIRENPKLKDDFLELPIKDLEIDEDGEEINVILYDDTNKQNKTYPFTGYNK